MKLHHYEGCSFIVQADKVKELESFFKNLCEDYELYDSYIEDTEEKPLIDVIKALPSFENWKIYSDRDPVCGAETIIYTLNTSCYKFGVTEANYGGYSCSWLISKGDKYLFENELDDFNLYDIGDGLPYVIDDMLATIQAAYHLKSIH